MIYKKNITNKCNNESWKSKLLSKRFEVEAELPASAAVLGVPVHLLAGRVVVRPETAADVKSERGLWLIRCLGMVVKAAPRLSDSELGKINDLWCKDRDLM